MPKENPQDRILNQLRKQKSPCVVHLTNGFQLKNAVIRGFDNFVVVIHTEEGRQMMIYKHAISSITMSQPIPLDPAADAHA
ncbi:MAG: RNA chaperone Hfq [Clostridiales bacterium]|jgi:host factor-I protein|nr:RNA chaperone Hfq [Clostridiales bacterium]